MCVCPFFFRVTCGLWESPPLKWQKVLPVSTLLWGEICCWSALQVTEVSLPGAAVALLPLHRALHGFKLAYLESRIILNQPGIHSFQSSGRILFLFKKKKGRKRKHTLGSLVCCTDWNIIYSGLLLTCHKTMTNSQDYKLQCMKVQN